MCFCSLLLSVWLCGHRLSLRLFGFRWPTACAPKTWWLSGTFLRYKGTASLRHLSRCHIPECQKKQVTLCFLVWPHFVTLALFWCLRVQQCVLTRNECDRKTEVQPWIQKILIHPWFKHTVLTAMMRWAWHMKLTCWQTNFCLISSSHGAVTETFVSHTEDGSVASAGPACYGTTRYF